MKKINIRKNLNESVRRIPHIGDVLTSEISAKRFATTTALAAHLMLGKVSPSKAATGFVEAMVGDKTTTFDTKIGATLTPKIGFVARNRLSIENKEVSPFTLIDLSYDIKNGLGPVLETQIVPGIGIDPRPGIQLLKTYDRHNNRWIIFALLSRSVKGKPNSELATLIAYERPLDKTMGMMVQLETATNWERRDNLNFSAERVRIGFRVNRYTIGGGADVLHLRNSPQAIVNWGGFVRFGF